MGAKTTASLYQKGELTKEEASYLLAFTNNIGPVYFISYIIPCLGISRPVPYIIGMYGIPLLYGLILRYTYFRKKIGFTVFLNDYPATRSDEYIPIISLSVLLSELENSIQKSIPIILSLGAYMIIFNLGNLFPYIITRKTVTILSILFEISGGVYLAHNTLPKLPILIALSFGGFCSIAQTYTCIKQTDLSLRNYILHKIIIASLTGYYYSQISFFF